LYFERKISKVQTQLDRSFKSTVFLLYFKSTFKSTIL